MLTKMNTSKRSFFCIYFNLRLQSYNLVPPMEDQMNNECSNVKGHWRLQDRSFGWKGMNIPRTRHASEVIKTLALINGKPRTIYTLWIFGGYNAVE